MKHLLGMLVALGLLLWGATRVTASPFSYSGGDSQVDSINWPTAGYDTHPSFVAVFEADGSTIVLTDPKMGPYDGVEDAYIGFVNESSSPISQVTVTSNNGAFGFDGDGIDLYVPPGISFGSPNSNNPLDRTGYGGPIGFFTNVTNTQATLNFDALAPGASTFASFEGDPGSLTGLGFQVATVPEPASFALFSLSLAGLAVCGWRRRKAVA